MLITMIILSGLLTTNGLAATKDVDLATAIAEFNARATEDEIGQTQQLLTEDEVFAAIRLWELPEDAQVSAELLSSFKEIAETAKLPANAVVEVVTGYDRGGDFVFDMWSVRITMERPDGSSYSFIIRETAVASRTLEEELNLIRSRSEYLRSGRRVPNWSREENRIRELESRIANSKR